MNPLIYVLPTQAEEKMGVNKYLIFDSMDLHSVDENKELLKNTVMFLMEL